MSLLICPYCGKPISGGMLTIKGNKYKCIYCNIWFTKKNGKLNYTRYMGIE